MYLTNWSPSMMILITAKAEGEPCVRNRPDDFVDGVSVA